MIKLYRPGTGILHRLPAAAKLAGLAVSALLLSVWPHDAWTVGGALLIVCLLYAIAGLPVRVLAAEAWRLRWLVLILATALWIFVGPLAAWISSARLVALVLLASLLTITTRMADLLSVLLRMLSPLRRGGVDVDSVAMTVSLTITMIPVVAGFAEQVRDAQRARGLRPGLRGIVPLLVRTLRHGDDVGDALAARGLV
ncbi:energy-coupling factor transporter transmembrane component T family protein [Microbacterium hydrocarbonoxydans]|uniref:energy-coupling factor transporter transmembrane component T family protein n=1 Tax=Microbacterium hydrocarbonoxydans TaxID=273678 RepID=UPI0007BC4025|nr:energy-coupling factor transporter transmembrane protein EcfT [Microbacterium hydrocarbonoxydans]GAT73324.1 hypothetical protein MHM582_1814 [Microbacterium sp. HM58-2]